MKFHKIHRRNSCSSVGHHALARVPSFPPPLMSIASRREAIAVFFLSPQREADRHPPCPGHPGWELFCWPGPTAPHRSRRRHSPTVRELSVFRVLPESREPRTSTLSLGTALGTVNFMSLCTNRHFSFSFLCFSPSSVPLPDFQSDYLCQNLAAAASANDQGEGAQPHLLIKTSQKLLTHWKFLQKL